MSSLVRRVSLKQRSAIASRLTNGGSIALRYRVAANQWRLLVACESYFLFMAFSCIFEQFSVSYIEDN